jgi:TetR/AcrR family transcriptional regulator
MGIAERKEREKQQRKNSILDAAEKVFFSKGFKDATMDDVAEAAELSKGTLYRYFKNKEDIHLGISARALSLLKAMFEDALRRGRSGIEKVREIGRAYFQFSQMHPDYFAAMVRFEGQEMDLTDAESAAFECHSVGTEVLKLVARAIETGREDGTIRPDLDAMKTAVLLWGQTDGVIRIAAHKCEVLSEFGDLTPEALVESFFEFARCAMKPEERGNGTADDS